MSAQFLIKSVHLLPKTFKSFDFSNILNMSIPDEGYSRNVSHAIN